MTINYERFSTIISGNYNLDTKIFNGTIKVGDKESWGSMTQQHIKEYFEIQIEDYI